MNLFQPYDDFLGPSIEERARIKTRCLLKFALVFQILAILFMVIWSVALTGHFQATSYSKEEMAGVITTVAMVFPIVLFGLALILVPPFFSLLSLSLFKDKIITKSFLILTVSVDLILFLIALDYFLQADATGYLVITILEFLSKVISLPILIVAIIRSRPPRIFPNF